MTPHPKPERRIYRLAALCGFLVALSLVVPRFVTNPEGGFAAGANAVLTLLAMLLAAALVSLYLLATTVRSYRELSPAARLAGIGPACVLVLALASLVLFLGY